MSLRVSLTLSHSPLVICTTDEPGTANEGVLRGC